MRFKAPFGASFLAAKQTAVLPETLYASKDAFDKVSCGTLGRRSRLSAFLSIIEKENDNAREYLPQLRKYSYVI